MDSFAAVGEALCVSILDLRGCNPHSRLIGCKALHCKDDMRINGEAHRLIQALAAGHNRTSSWDWDRWLFRNAPRPPLLKRMQEKKLISKEVLVTRLVYEVIHKPCVFIRDEPSVNGEKLGFRKFGAKIVVSEERSDGWVQLAPEEEECKDSRNRGNEKKNAYALVCGKSLGLSTLLKRLDEVEEVKMTVMEYVETRLIQRIPMPRPSELV